MKPKPPSQSASLPAPPGWEPLKASPSGRGGTQCRRGRGCDVRKVDIVPKKNNKLLPLAKELRRDMTPEERHLWYDFLRSYPIKIYKQRIIGRFVVDFYCHKAKLVIELDGSQHYTDDGMAYDAERTALLNSCELHVIRFSNSDVKTNFENVCAAIDEIIKARC